MFQQVLVLLVFAVAVFFAVRKAIKSFQAKDTCDTGCGKCGTVDVDAIEKKIRQKGI